MFQALYRIDSDRPTAQKRAHAPVAGICLALGLLSAVASLASPSLSSASPGSTLAVSRTAGQTALQPLPTIVTASTEPAIAEQAGTAGPPEDAQPLCLFVASYHRGDSWQDGIERGLRDKLADRCRIIQFDMDTKRRRDPGEMREAAAEAYELFSEMEPDLVITADDNAARHFLVPYLLDKTTPIVFSGIDWTVEDYGFPTDNITGIVEIAPIRPLFREALNLSPGAKRAAYIGADTAAERKNHERLARMADGFGIVLDGLLVDDLDAWKKAYSAAQEYDFLIAGSSSGINRWVERKASRHAYTNLRRPCFTNHEGMMQVCGVGFTNLPEEHGELAAATARAILDGLDVQDIPLITNRKWDTWLNVELGERMGVAVPDRLLNRAKKTGHLVDRATDDERLPQTAAASPETSNAAVSRSLSSTTSVTLGHEIEAHKP